MAGRCGGGVRAPCASTAACPRPSAFLPVPVRLLIVKDLRLFRRDPLQWSQFLIFLGLLALYFFNIRRFTYRRRLRRLGEHGQLPEPRGGGTAAVDVHDPLHLSP